MLGTAPTEQLRRCGLGNHDSCLRRGQDWSWLPHRWNRLGTIKGYARGATSRRSRPPNAPDHDPEESSFGNHTMAMGSGGYGSQQANPHKGTVGTCGCESVENVGANGVRRLPPLLPGPATTNKATLEGRRTRELPAGVNPIRSQSRPRQATLSMDPRRPLRSTATGRKSTNHPTAVPCHGEQSGDLKPRPDPTQGS